MNNILQRHYTFDNESGVWHDGKTASFAYSDGSDVEDAMLLSLRGVSDKSVMSEELFELQKDWPTYYHFSAMRANLLRPLAGTVLHQAKVLELGCGCGAISRYLAETAAEVCAVEGSPKRASIAAARCHDLNNIHIVADSIQNLPEDLGKFDVVTLIGVLEYAAVFDSGPTPALSLLRTARNFLKEDGCLILAIENKMGLKYFSGIPEDHLQIAWGGIAGAYREHDVRTYSRQELITLLEAAGFTSCSQFIPIPDYKLPTSVMTPTGMHMPRNEWNAAGLLGANRRYEAQPIFNLPNSWCSVLDADLLPEMANSLCFVAQTKQKGKIDIWDDEVLLYHYGQTLRDSKKYAKCATFRRVGQDVLVHRTLLYGTTVVDNEPYTFRPESEPYIQGIEILAHARRITSRPGWTVECLAKALSPWMKELQKHLNHDGTLPSHLCDASPFNAMLTASGEVKFFDLEWVASKPIPFLSTVTNHLYTSFDRLGGAHQPASGTPVVYPELAMALLNAWDLNVSMEDIKTAAELSETLWTYVLGEIPDWEKLCSRSLYLLPSVSWESLALTVDTYQKQCSVLTGTVDTYKKQCSTLADTVDTYQKQCSALVDTYQKQCSALAEKIRSYEESRSWKLTAPLRKFNTFFKRGVSAANTKTDKVKAIFGHRLERILPPVKPIYRIGRRGLNYYRKNGFCQLAKRTLYELRQGTLLQHFSPDLPPLPTTHDQCTSESRINIPSLPVKHDQYTRVSHISYADASPYIFDNASLKPIAFYLPQFHPFPENDLWWGKDFTEWTNVKKASPLFSGHYHPKEPSTLGYYDLRSPGVMKRQAEMAKKFGVYGFCFHYYWFDGKRLMERPIDDLLKDPSIDFPFCLNWANENWSRRWDGRDRDVLIEQKHSPSDDIAVINDLMRYFRDPRYIRVDGRPFFLIYHPSLFPDIRTTLERWRDECVRQGEKPPFFAMCQTFNNYDPNEYGFDVAVQFPPHLPASNDGFTWTLPPLDTLPDWTGYFIEYDIAADCLMESYNPALPAYPGVFPSWDNTARRGKAATIFHGSTPELYAQWLERAGMEVKKYFPSERQFVFINAWNEWAEGAYLEPDAEYGYAYLNATSKTLSYLEEGKTLSSDVDPAGTCFLFIGHDASLAGAQIMLLHTLRWLKRHTKIDIKLVLLADGVLRKEFEKVCDTYVANSTSPSFEDIKSFCRYPNVICANTVVAPCCFNAISEYSVPIITWVHEMEKSIQRFSNPKSIDLMIKHSTFYIADSNPVRENLVNNLKINNESIAVINAYIEVNEEPDPADKASLRKLLGLPIDGLIITGLGTSDWRKGVDLFIDTAKIICDRMPDVDVYFCWIGSGEDPNIRDPEVLTKEYGIEDRVFFVGVREDRGDFLNASDLFLLTSREDPFPLASLEACAACLPVICFADSGGMPEFISSGAGIVVPYEDVTAMADAAIDLLGNDKKRLELGKIARKLLLENHTVDSSVPHILALLRRFAEKPHPVSVIVPNYNYAEYLPQRMESIFNQTYRDMEIIILDDASIDDSLEVIRRWESRAGVRVILNEKNSKKVNLQWKKGILEARGEFIWMAEADDCCEESFLEKMLMPLQDSDVVMAYSIPKVIDAEGRLENEFDYRKSYLSYAGTNLWDCGYVIDGNREIREKLGIINCIPNVSATLFRKQPAKTSIDKALDFKCSGDWMFYLTMALNGKIAYVHGDFAYHRRHDKSVIAIDIDNKNALMSEEIEEIYQWVIANIDIDEDVMGKMNTFKSEVF